LTLEPNTTPVIPDTVLSLCVGLQQLNSVVFVVVVANVCLQYIPHIPDSPHINTAA